MNYLIFIRNRLLLHSSIIFLTPLTHSASIKIIFESINGIRSVSDISIKIVAPLSQSMPIWRGLRAEDVSGIDFVDAEPGAQAAMDGAVTASYLLSMVRGVSPNTTIGIPGSRYLFVGVETYADAFAECAFTLRRRLGAASIFALDTRAENAFGCPADIEWKARHSLASRATLLTFNSRFGIATSGGMPVKVLSDPRFGKVSVEARTRARKRMNLSDADFVLAVASDESSLTDSAGITRVTRYTALIGAWMRAPGSRLLIVGDRHGAVTPWLADLSATFPGRTRITAAPSGDDADAVDLLLKPGRGQALLHAFSDVGNTTGPREVVTENPHQTVVFDEDATADVVDAVDDFIQAVDLLPLQAGRQIELLRSSFVSSLRAKMGLRFGQSLFYAITTA